MKKAYETGIYDISSSEYHNSPGISRSGIVEFMRSPKHFWHKYLNPDYVPKPSTPDLLFGSAFHTYVLEPDKFDLEYVINLPKREKLPEVPLLKDAGRRVYDEAKKIYEAERLRRKQEDEQFYFFSQGKNVIEQADFDMLRAMGTSLTNDTQANAIISNAQYEKSLYWIDEETGLLCKCRPDIWHPNYVVDLKTARDASEREFQRVFYSSKYYLQFAMMSIGIKAVTGKPIEACINLVIEKEEPYCHAIYPVDESAIQHGIEEFRNQLRKLKVCFDKNEWPSYSIKNLTLPAYARIEE